MVPSDESVGDIVPDPSDALEFQKVKRAKPKRRWFLVLLLLILTGTSGGAGWYYYGDQLMAGNNDELPVIRAAEGPVKVRPKTPGGMSIPDRDKLVYDRMNGDTPEPLVERLLPPPETPKVPPEANLSTKPQKLVPAKSPVEELTATTTEPSASSKQEPSASSKQEPSASSKQEPSASSKQEPSAAIKQESSVPDVKKPQTQIPTQTLMSRLAYQIQIAAVRSRVLAEGEWKRLKKKHDDLLGGYSLNVVRADLGAEKGIFFRLRAGPIADEAAAQALCKNLAKRKVGCLIVRPGG